MTTLEVGAAEGRTRVDVLVPFQGVPFLGDRIPRAARTGPGESPTGLRSSVAAPVRSALGWYLAALSGRIDPVS